METTRGEVADVVRRLASRDLSLWPAGSVAAGRLGWLELPREMRSATEPIRRFADEARQTHLGAVLFGMGGSSLAPIVYRQMSSGPLAVLDTTHPGTVAAMLDAAIPGDIALVASKSGTTIEPASLLAIWRDRVPDPGRTAAITDPGTVLDSLATDAGFRAVFRSRADVGGRYSALSPFGLVPAALCGLDLDALLAFDEADLEAGVALGLHLAREHAAGRDKVTLLAPAHLAPFGLWVEQLLAESTGKLGTGLVPVAGEDPGTPQVYGPDRTFVALCDNSEDAGASALEGSGLPVLRQRLDAPAGLGELFFRWEVATAVAGARLGVDPFDEPDVAVAKAATATVLEAWPDRLPEPAAPSDLLGFIDHVVHPGDYLALLAYLPETPAVESGLAACQARLRDRYRVAVTRGYGPRYLHSTGQLHKGGPDRVVALQLLSGPSAGRGDALADLDLPVPGRSFTLARLYAAQALGDFRALVARRRRVLRVDLGDDPAASLAEVASYA